MRQQLAELKAFTGFDVSQEIANLKKAIANAEEAAALVAGFPEQVRAREQEILSKIPPELLVVRKLPDGEPIDLEAARAMGFAKYDLRGETPLAYRAQQEVSQRDHAEKRSIQSNELSRRDPCRPWARLATAHWAVPLALMQTLVCAARRVATHLRAVTRTLDRSCTDRPTE